ncbi:MAG: GHKL domain-containing protein [Eubacterium sp.]|nr:GHKL domain-containing protein [Eubacterium sp.]
MQNVLWMILELIMNLLEAFLCVHFVIKAFNGKCKLLGLKSVYMIGIVGFTAIVTALNQLTEYEGVLGLIYAAYLAVFSLIFLRGALLKKVFISVLTLICLVSTATVTGNILLAIFKSNPTEIYTEQSLERFAFMVMGVALLAYVLKLFSHFTSGSKEGLKPKEWILILSILGISFFIITVLHVIILSNENKREHIDFLVLSEICIIFINILCLYTTLNLSETHKREEQLVIDQRRSEYSQQYAQMIKDQYEQMRRMRHDMKQYADTMYGLLKTENMKAAKSLVEEQTEILSNIETVINVDNDFLNAILNSKLSVAKLKKIDILCSIENNISGIEDIDLCNLVGNLLDNAITAAEKCEPDSRLIEIKISSSGSKLVVIVRNSIWCSVLSENPKLKSTKENSCEHGFGIKTIKYIAEKYDGKADFYEENLTFICKVELRKETFFK